MVGQMQLVGTSRPSLAALHRSRASLCTAGSFDELTRGNVSGQLRKLPRIGVCARVAVQGLSPHCACELAANPVVTQLAEGLEAPVQLTYLSLLLALLSGAAFAVVRQVLVRREMDERSKVLGELIRTGDATSEDYFELGVVLARKRLYTQALKNYTKAVKLWDGEDVELAQVHNAMGFCYMSMEKTPQATREFETATQLQPGYVTAWNNLGDVLEKEGKWKEALPAYEAAYGLDPENTTARLAVERLRTRSRRMSSTM